MKLHSIVRSFAFIVFVCLLAAPLQASQFFGITDTSPQGQKLALEGWLTDNLQDAFSRFIPQDMFYIQTHVVLAQPHEQMAEVYLGKLNDFTPVEAHFPSPPKALLQRIKQVTFDISVNNRVSKKAAASLIDMAKKSVPLLNSEQVLVNMHMVAPPSPGISDFWHAIEWPFTAIVAILIFCLTLMRISGVEWPHLRKLFADWLQSYRDFVREHRKFVKERVEAMPDRPSAAPDRPSAAASNTQLAAPDSQFEVSTFINHLGIGEIAALVTDKTSDSAAIYGSLNVTNRNKLQRHLDSRTWARIVAADPSQNTISMGELESRLMRLRVQALSKNNEMPPMTAKEEREIYRELSKNGHHDKMARFVREFLPGDICFELPADVLSLAFTRLEIQQKIALLISLDDETRAGIVAKAVAPQSKLERILNDEIAGGGASHVAQREAQIQFIANCRELLKNNPEIVDEFSGLIDNWLKEVTHVRPKRVA